MKRSRAILLYLVIVLVVMAALPLRAEASISLSIDGVETPQGTADTLQILLLLTVLTLAPSILIMMTSFARILIVFSFTRNAMGLQQTPPNQVLVGLALFLTFFLMSPIFSQINAEAYQPYVNQELTQQEAIDAALKPLRTFMLRQTSNDSLNFFLNLAGETRPVDADGSLLVDDLKTEVIIPAFIVNELKQAFKMGFFIYIPFLIIDLVVASTLMSMGMMMLPPAMISMPFKLIVFILVDGWTLIIQTLFASFN